MEKEAKKKVAKGKTAMEITYKERQNAWYMMRAIITDLYDNQDKPLREIMEIMAKDHGFRFVQVLLYPFSLLSPLSYNGPNPLHRSGIYRKHLREWGVTIFFPPRVSTIFSSDDGPRFKQRVFTIVDRRQNGGLRQGSPLPEAEQENLRMERHRRCFSDQRMDSELRTPSPVPTC